MTPSRTAFLKDRLALISLLLLAFALRIWGLDDRNIWWDEGLVAWAARLPVREILNWTAHDVHPPLYFLMQRAWWLFVGDGEFGMRYTSVLTGTLAVALIYPLGRALGGRRAGTLAALFLAVSPFAVSWSQEMRMYIAAAAAAILALWAAVRWWQTGRLRYGLAYVCAASAGLWLLYLSVSVLIIANLAFLGLWIGRNVTRGLIARWIAAQLAVLALYLPWLIYALPRIPTWSTAEPFTLPVFVQLYATTLALGASENLDRYLLPTLLVLALWAFTLPLVWRTLRAPARRAGVLMLLWGVALPALLVYLVSLPVHIFYAPRLAPRYLLPLAACFYTLLALGLAALARRQRVLAALGTALVVGVALLGLAQFYPDRIRRDDLWSLADTLRALRQPGDAVVLYSDRDWPLFAAQYAGEWRGVPNGATMQPDAASWLLEPIWQVSDGLWLATTPDALRMDPQGLVRAWLDARAVSVTRWDYGEHTLAFYARTPARTAEPMAVMAAYHLPQRAFRQAQDPTGALAGAVLPMTRYAVGDTLHLALLWRAPAQTVTVTLAGPTSQRLTQPVNALPAGRSRQQIDIYLSSDLPAGRYTVQVQPDDAPAQTVGALTLVQLNPSAAATLSPAATPLDVQLGEAIHLVGYERRPDVLHPGDTLDLTLYWRTDEPQPARYKVFTHLLGATWHAANGNFIWGQVDSEPAGGVAPTTTWTPGALIADHYRIPLAADAPAGDYRLEVGLYNIVSGERLRTPAGADALDLGIVSVTLP